MQPNTPLRKELSRQVILPEKIAPAAIRKDRFWGSLHLFLEAFVRERVDDLHFDALFYFFGKLS